ncbi:MAG: hypothetical protein ABIR32_09305 [Ilumatobacteraceae bacterium]
MESDREPRRRQALTTAANPAEHVQRTSRRPVGHDGVQPNLDATRSGTGGRIRAGGSAIQRVALSSTPPAGRIQPMGRTGGGHALVQREILDSGDLSVETSTIDGYDDGDHAGSVKSELKAAYYGDGGSDVSLEDLAEELWEASETNKAMGPWIEAGMSMDDIADEISRLHEIAPTTETRRDEMAEALQANASAKAKLAFAAAEKLKMEKERVSKTKQRNDVCGVIAAYAGTGNAALSEVVRRGLLSSEGIDKTLASGLTKSAADLKAMKTAWRKLGDNAPTAIQDGVSLARIKMWSPGSNADVGKKKVRGDVVDHNVNFMFSIEFAEGGGAEFNIHVDVDKADWIA